MTLKLNGSSAGSVSLNAPASTTGSADIEFKLPVADGSSNQFMKTDGSGNLSFGTVDTSIADGSITTAKFANSVFQGKITQVHYSMKTNISSYSTSGGSFVDVGMSVNITPATSNGTILIDGVLHFSGSDGYHYTTRMVRTVGSTTNVIAYGDGSQSSVMEGLSHWYLYPTNGQYTIFPATFFAADNTYNTTSQVTYKLQLHSYAGGTVYVNRTYVGQDANYNGTAISTIRVMEIQGAG